MPGSTSSRSVRYGLNPRASYDGSARGESRVQVCSHTRVAPIATLKGEKQAHPGGVSLRNGLVVLQFALSMILLVGVGVMYRQIEYMKGRDLHFDRDGVVVLPVAPRDFADREGAVERIATLRDRLAQRSVVASVSASGAVPSRFGGSFTLVRPEGEEDRTPLDWRFVVVDDRFFDTYGIDFVEGRGFSRDFATDAETGVVLNRAALRVLGWDRATSARPAPSTPPMDPDVEALLRRRGAQHAPETAGA